MTDTIAIDNGAETVTIDSNAPDSRSQMLASANAIATSIIGAENTLAETAKAWGTAIFCAVHNDNLSLDSLIGDSKVAAGWTMLTASDAGKKAKARLEVYFSNARLVAENWKGLPDDVQRDILAGVSSVHYVASQLRKVASDAAKEAKKEAKRLEAEKADTETETEAPATDVSEATFADVIAALVRYAATVSEAELLANVDALNAAYAGIDARINAVLASDAPVQQAA